MSTVNPTTFNNQHTSGTCVLRFSKFTSSKKCATENNTYTIECQMITNL